MMSAAESVPGFLTGEVSMGAASAMSESKERCIV